MFELADRLVGIYKTHNCTKSATINPESFLNNCAIANPYQNKVLRRSSFFCVVPYVFYCYGAISTVILELCEEKPSKLLGSKMRQLYLE
jgi:hypothetical protein